MESEDVHMAPKQNEFQERLKKKLMGSSILDSFTKLSSDKEKIRIEAGMKLLNNLNYNATNEQESDYTLDRLIRGVGSSRNSAKTGYYSVLVALLSKFSFVTVNNVLETIKKHLSTGGSNSKSENADIYMGQILVCGALIHSGLYVKATPEEQNTILQMLINAGSKRSYLTLAAYTFLIELIDKLDDDQFKIVWEAVKETMLKPWLEQTLDSIYFLSAARTKFPSIVKSKTINKTLEVPEIVHEDSLVQLCNILLNIPSLKSLKHPVYHKIANEIQNKSLVEEWCTEMDKQIQKPNRSKLLIITTFQIEFLANITDSTIIPSMLTNNYVAAIVHNFKNSRPKDRDDEFIHKMDIFFKDLTKKLESDDVSDKTKIAIMKKLLFYPGTFIFEKVTRTKIIQYITSSLSHEGVKTLSKLYKEVVLANTPKIISENVSETWINSDRIYAAQLLVKLLGHSAVAKDITWRLEQLKFLVNVGFFKDEESSIGVELAAALKDCFYHSLDQRLPKLEDLRNILSSLVHYINDNVFVNSTHQLRNNLTEEGMGSWEEMMKLVSKLEGKTKLKHSYAIPVFHTLFLHMGLQLFSDFEMAQNALTELHSCFARLEMETPKKKKKIEEDEPVWIEVVVDLFLSFLSQNSHLLRSIINCVFPFLCPHLTEGAIRQILDVLDPKNEQNPLSKGDDDDDDDDSDASDEEKKEKEDEKDDDVDEDEVIEEDDEESDDSGLEEEDLDNEEESKTDKLRMAVRDALHKTGYQTDDESEDMDKMDDEEGKKLDDALASAFKLIKKSRGKKNKQSKNDKTLTHFRVRVLDLIDIYLDSEPSMIRCLEIVCLLLQTLEFSIRDVHQKPLEHRVRSCLKKVSSMKKFNSMEETTEEVLANMLNSFLEKGSKTSFIYQDMGDMIAECCMFIVRCSQILNSEKTPSKKSKSKITDIFKNALETFFNKRDSLLPLPLFKNVLQLSWEGNWCLVPLLVNYAFKNDIRPFRRSQALDLLNIFYLNSRFRTLNPEQFKQNISPLEKELSIKALELLQNLAVNTKESKIKEKFVCLLLTLLSSVKTAKNCDDIDWKTIGEAVREYRSHVTLAKDAKLAYNKFCRVLGISNLVKMQLTTVNGHDDSDSDDNSQNDDHKHKEKKRKKAKSSKKDAHKLKKEAQLLRLKASSEGLTDDVAFSNVNLTEIKTDLVEDISENEEPKMKKKKNKHAQENGVDSSEPTNKLKGKSKKNKQQQPQQNGNISTDDNEEQFKKTKHINGKQSTKKRHNSESENNRPTKKKNKK